jgi:hypothetical protein
MKFDNIIKAAFAVAALVGAGTYAFNTFFSSTDSVQAAGVDTSDGWDVTPMGVSRQGGFFALTKYAKDPSTDEAVHTVTIYELVKKGQSGEADLFYVGSRVIQHDAGLPMMKFDPKSDADYNPDKMKEYMEKASKGGGGKKRR